MRLFPPKKFESIGTALFEAAGAPAAEARLVARSLVRSSLAGHDSHGVMRIPEYLRLVEQGTLRPGAPVEVRATSATTAVVDCGLNFGMVGATRAVETAIEIAREHKTACVTTRRCNHVGRLGEYVETAARAGVVAIATCNSPISGHFVLPFGGREGRLATNPIAYGIPSAGDPIVADFATSVAPEGKVRVYHNQDKPLPEGWVVDADGDPTTDAKDFYGPPRGGILPLGGAAGHKGFALGLLVEILSGVLNGVATTDPEAVGNGCCFVAVDPAAFCPEEVFLSEVSRTIDYMKSSAPAPGFEEVFVPGEIEFLTARRRAGEGIPVDEPTWRAIGEHAERLRVPIEGMHD